MLKSAIRSMLLLSLVITLPACGTLIDKFDAPPPLMSPCVGSDESPCGEKRPANQWLVEHARIVLAV